MNKYEVEFTKSSQKELNKLPKQTVTRILKNIDKLSENPRAGSVRPMVGISSWRLRVGEYRVVYDIHDGKLTIMIIRIRHRKDIYRK
ncbi:MAG: type II toxin-antitoxin system RelE/ParE family toxin [Patescibacteria group bacterium]|jgi:mRNA interferase RelE/StbE|nr:type II toxin-antitoxin system RelE/ParE family toxin [Patescibacteria group bacterium]